MKKVLITGINSYVGNRFAEWVEQYPDDYEIDKVSVRDDKWKEMDLSIYDAILHVAGIAHRRETKENKTLYFRVNQDLSQEIALKAKEDGVKHFVFLSSMSVYGLDEGVIDQDTPLLPKSHYGKSKLQAEENISELADASFKVAILRPPMIYGQDCKGNYSKLAKVACKLPIFPEIDNERSMLHIDNLSEFLRLIIKNEEFGLFLPQNKEYVKTSEMVKTIAEVNNKKIYLTKVFNPIVLLIISRVSIVNKVFGKLVYDKGTSEYKMEYRIRSFRNSITNTEKGK